MISKRKLYSFGLVITSLLLIINLEANPEHLVWAMITNQTSHNPASSVNHSSHHPHNHHQHQQQHQQNLGIFHYDNGHAPSPLSSGHHSETTTTLPYYLRTSSTTISSQHSGKMKNNSIHDIHHYDTNDDDEAQQRQQPPQPQPPRTDLYTVELTSKPPGNDSITGHNPNALNHLPRQAKHDDYDGIVYNYKCPKQHFIHPCDCLELDKRAEMYENGQDEGSGMAENPDDLSIGNNGTPTFDLIEEEPVHPDLIETVVLCKNIRNVQVLTEAVRGFQGHRVNYMVLDGCKLPPFPNSLFKGIHIVWMEFLNSTIQFHDNFFNMKHCP